MIRDRALCQPSLARGFYVQATSVDHIVCKALWLHLHGTLDGVDDPTNLQAIGDIEHERKSRREAELAKLGWPGL